MIKIWWFFDGYQQNYLKDFFSMQQTVLHYIKILLIKKEIYHTVIH